MERRDFLKRAIGAAALAATGPLACRAAPEPPPADGWNAGPLAHLLPTASHERIRLKASFRSPLAEAPQLALAAQTVQRPGARSVRGRRRDSLGRFFTFDAKGLEPATTYTLRITSARGEPLCDAWPLRTLPAPDARPEHLRVLVYTCAGGPDGVFDFGLTDAFLPIAHRQRLFARALRSQPDAVIAIGDHVYWDLRSRGGRFMGRGLGAWWSAGHFDFEQPIVGTANEEVLRRAFAPQIAGLYGVRFRSVPTFFLQDDHDYGENDEADDRLRTLPPDAFSLDLARTTQDFFYPELIAHDLPDAFVRADGCSESYGSFRYGRLFEALLYDCRRHVSNASDPALGHARSAFVPPQIEAWLASRSRNSPCAHVAHVPSTPVLWSAGKWGEWYPDFHDADGVLSATAHKPYWPGGWAAQHDRLLLAAASRGDRLPLFVSGDLHAIAAGRIHETNGQSLATNPVVSLLAGPIGTGWLGWPSRARKQLPQPSGTLRAEEIVRPIEQNGFTLLDIDPDRIEVSQFRWLPEQGEAAIDALEPFQRLEFARPRAAA